jgi:hypothetical protein
MANIAVFTLVDGETGTGAEAAFSPWRASNTFHAEGIVAGDTIAVQASNDGTNFFTLYTFTADGLVSIDEPYVKIRGNVTAVAGGGTLYLYVAYEAE